MFDLLLRVLEKALGLETSLESRKYQDKFIRLKGDYYEEFNKDLAIRSDAVLDNIRRELCDLADSFSASPGKPVTPN